LNKYTDTDSWQIVEQRLCSVVSILERFDQLISEREWEELDLLTRLSVAKVHVGLCLSHLLRPSPVDPVIADRTTRRCLQLLVSAICVS